MKIEIGSYLMNKCDYQHRIQMIVSCLDKFDISLKFQVFVSNLLFNLLKFSSHIKIMFIFFISEFKLTLRLCCHNNHQLSKFHLKTLDSHCIHLNLRFLLLFVTIPKLFRHYEKKNKLPSYSFNVIKRKKKSFNFQYKPIFVEHCL